MTGDEKPQKKKRRLPGILFSLVSLAVLTYIAIMLISGQGLGFSWLTSLFSDRTPPEAVDEFYFDVGRNRVFADLGGPIAAAGTFGVQVISESGVEMLRDPFRMSSPAINSEAGRAVVFDIGGTAVRVFNETQITTSLETGGSVVSASINRNGWFCVCTQESGVFRSIVTVYDGGGREVYKVSLASGYALSALLTSDNKRLAILDLTDDGSRITLYELSHDSAGAAFEIPGGLILDIRYLPGGEVLAVTQESLIVIDAGGSGKEFYDFSGRRLGGYVLDGNFITLYLLDYGVGYNGRLVTLRENGKIIAERITDSEIVSMSSSGRFLTVLRNDCLSSFDSEFNEFPTAGSSISPVGATRIVTLANGAALAAGDRSAVVIRFERSAGS